MSKLQITVAAALGENVTAPEFIVHRVPDVYLIGVCQTCTAHGVSGTDTG